MKIISNLIESKPGIVPAPQVQQITDVEPILIPYPPTTPIVVSTTQKLTWKKSNLEGIVKEIRFNAHLKAWMNEDKSFANWLWSIVSAHITVNPLDAITYPLPDQFIDEYGIKCITLETFSKECLDSPLDNYGKKRPQPVLDGATIHILI